MNLLIEESVHGESHCLTVDGRWLVNQRGELNKKLAEQIKAEHAALLAVAESAKKVAETIRNPNLLEALATLAQIQKGE